MKLAIVGGRDFNNIDLMLEELVSFPGIVEIVSGGARGADYQARAVANSCGYLYKEFPADWDTYGKSAGYRRNKEIVDYCDGLVAFWDGESKGTKHSIDLARKARKLLKIVYY